MNYKDEILKLKREKNAIILAHYYTNNEIQEIADYLGDSLYLSQVALTTNADIIVFCGVHFMAETAKILNPQKKVLLPVMEAGCKMADMITAEELQKFKDENPNTKIITYVNSSAAVKALSDCVCTSTNAIKIIDYYQSQGYDILYTPDKNLASYASSLSNRQINAWQGYCPIHHFLKKEEVLSLVKTHPNALVLAHPECNGDVLEIASYVGSTKQLLEYAKKSDATEFIVCTECGIIHQMQRDCPNKNFYIASPSLNCKDMKFTTLESVYNVLLNEVNEIKVDENVSAKAKLALDKMLEITNS